MAPIPYSDVSAAVGFFVLVALFAGGEEFLIIRTLVRHEGARADRGTHLLSAGCVVVPRAVHQQRRHRRLDPGRQRNRDQNRRR